LSLLVSCVGLWASRWYTFLFWMWWSICSITWCDGLPQSSFRLFHATAGTSVLTAIPSLPWVRVRIF